MASLERSIVLVLVLILEVREDELLVAIPTDISPEVALDEV